MARGDGSVSNEKGQIHSAKRDLLAGEGLADLKNKSVTFT